MHNFATGGKCVNKCNVNLVCFHHTWNNENEKQIMLLLQIYIYLSLSLCLYLCLVKYVINNFASKLSQIKYDFYLDFLVYRRNVAIGCKETS